VLIFMNKYLTQNPSFNLKFIRSVDMAWLTSS
jgi:hypothetical protein